MSISVVRKKLSIRSWRRGTKELDLILGQFSQENLINFEMSELELYEQFLSIDDHLIYNWLFEKEESPRIYKSLVKQIKKSMHR
jgi:antitoxin CptB